MNPHLREATPGDCASLVDLMSEFYAESVPARPAASRGRLLGGDAFVDDLFIRPPFRGRGLGKLALAEVRAACEQRGVRALHLEVGRDNGAAHSLYRRAGFGDTDRQLLTLKLADPTHLP
jgi:ribosomal protein S18 acetylase RimI-like enzyme